MQSQGSLIYTGPTRLGTLTYIVSITPVPISSENGASTNGIKSSSTPTNQPNNNPNPNNNNPLDNNNFKRNITIVVPYMQGTGEKFKKFCKRKGIQVHCQSDQYTIDQVRQPQGQGPQKQSNRDHMIITNAHKLTAPLPT